MNQSAYVSAPSDAMARALLSAYGGCTPVVVPNTFPLQPQPTALPLKRRRPSSGFRRRLEKDEASNRSLQRGH